MVVGKCTNLHIIIRLDILLLENSVHDRMYVRMQGILCMDFWHCTSDIVCTGVHKYGCTLHYYVVVMQVVKVHNCILQVTFTCCKMPSSNKATLFDKNVHHMFNQHDNFVCKINMKMTTYCIKIWCLFPRFTLQY